MKISKPVAALGAVFFAVVAISAHAAIGIEPGERPAPTVTIYATPQEVEADDSTTLTWFSRNAISCYASGAWNGSKSRSGSKRVTPVATSDYELTCRGRGGTTSASVTVVVAGSSTETPEPPTDPDPPEPPKPTEPPPTCSVSSSKVIALVNEEIVISWTSTNADYVITGDKGPANGTTTASYSTSGVKVFTVTSYGPGGKASCSTSIEVKGNELPPLPPPPPTPTCPVYTTPSCGANQYVTTGPSDSNGCVGALRCSVGTVTGLPSHVSFAGLGVVASGSEYGGSGKAGGNAFLIKPPDSTSASAQSVTSNLNIDSKKVWWLGGKIGLSPISTGVTPPEGGGSGGVNGAGNTNIRGAAYGGSVRVTVTAIADKIDLTDAASEVLFERVVSPQTGVVEFKVPIGIWGMRPNLKLEAKAQKTAIDASDYGVVLDGLNLFSYGDRPEMSIVRNHMMWASESSQNSIIGAIAKIPTTFLHESMATIGSSWFQAPLLKRTQDQGKGITIVVTVNNEDLKDGASTITTPRCPWPISRFSETDMEKYEKRLRANLDQYKKSGVNVLSVEVGNELDLYCFGGADIPYDRAPTDADYKLFLDTYVKFLEITVSVVKRPEYYPNAVIVLGAPAIDWSPAQGKLDPVKMYKGLANYNGKNYFDLVDAIGIHLYPNKSDEKSSLGRARAYMQGIGQSSRPVWISEWGYRTSMYTGLKPSEDRYRSFVQFYDSVLRNTDFKVVHMAHYMLDDFNLSYTVVGGDYNLLNEARFFSQYQSPAESPPVVLSEERGSLACVGCTFTEWLDEIWASVKDRVLVAFGN